jgi:hypothetical protein
MAALCGKGPGRHSSFFVFHSSFFISVFGMKNEKRRMKNDSWRGARERAGSAPTSGAG